MLYGGVAAAILIVVVAALSALSLLREQIESRTILSAQSLARSVEQTLEGMVDAIDIALLTSTDEFTRQMSMGKINPESITTMLVRHQTRLPLVDNIRASNERGESIYGLGSLSPPVDISDRDYFVRLRDDPNAGLFIAQPIIGRHKQKWVWLFARRINKPDGSFGGVIFASMFVEQIEKLLSQVNMGPDSALALRDSELRLIARNTFGSANTIPTGDQRLSTPFMEALKANPHEGTFVSDASSVDPLHRRYSYHRSQKYGFTVNVGIPIEAALADWRKEAWTIGGLVLAFVLAMLAFLFHIRRAWRLQDRDISARKRAETLLRTRLRFTELAQGETLDRFLQQVLDVAEEVTGSRIGFFHFVDPDQERLTLQAWSTNTLAHMCTAKGKGQHYAISEAGIWVDAFHARAPVIHNDYAGYAKKKGLPEGHAPVIRELVVPIIRKGKVTEIIGVGNKASDYVESDVEALQVIAEMVQDLTDRIRAETDVRTLSRAMEQSPASVVITDRDGRIEYVNPRFEQVTGYSRSEAIGANPRILKSGTVPSEVYAQLWAAILAGDEWRGELCNRRKNGELFWEYAAISGLKNERGEVAHFIAVKEDISERKRAEDSARLAHQQLRQLATQLNRMHEAESGLLSRELHDEFGQMLTSIKMDLSWLASRLGEAHPDLKKKVDASLGLVDASVKSVRSIAARLRPRILDELGLLSAIDWLVQDFRERSGIDSAFVADAKVGALSPERSTAVFRIVQESLSNIARHADAKCIDVSLHEAEGWLTLEIRDDGKGVRQDETSGYESIGLLGMRERALAAGGELLFDSVLGRGTVVTLRLPIAEQGA